MRALSSFLAALLLTACTAMQPVSERPDPLFRDDLFAVPSDRIDPADVLAVSEDMRRYARRELAPPLRRGGPIALVEALNTTGRLKLEYDAAITRNAAQAFEARAGNCLSLVLMTAALARELGLQVRFQSAFKEEAWSRSSDMLVRSGHVNILIDRRPGEGWSTTYGKGLIVDFLPPEDIRGLRTVEITEQTVIAMFMNNRAVEALVDGRIDDAYAWVREAVRLDPSFIGAYNTLGVIYLRHGELALAAQAFEGALRRDGRNTRALSNLADLRARQGRKDEADALYRRLAELEPEPPFHYFDLGQAAMKRGDYRAARSMFAREVARADYNSEFHYWLALANFHLGELAAANRHLGMARDYSTTRRERDLYAAKLAWLRASGK